ncbi:hypothetical protein AAMO2058_000507200 [Amorphochlora amoebiformis]
MVSKWALSMFIIHSVMITLYSSQLLLPGRNTRLKNTFYLSIAYACDAVVFTVVVTVEGPWQLEVVVDALSIFLCYLSYLYIAQQYCEANYKIVTMGQLPKYQHVFFYLTRIFFTIFIMLSILGQTMANRAWWRTFQWIATSFIGIVFGVYGVYTLFSIRHHLKIQIEHTEQNSMRVSVAIASGKQSFTGTVSQRRGVSELSSMRKEKPRISLVESSQYCVESQPGDVARNPEEKSAKGAPHPRGGSTAHDQGAGKTIPIMTKKMQRELKRCRRLKRRIEILLVILLPLCIYVGSLHAYRAVEHAFLSESSRE